MEKKIIRQGLFELHISDAGEFTGYRLTYPIPNEAAHLFMESGFIQVIGKRCYYIRSFKMDEFQNMQYIIAAIKVEVTKWHVAQAQMKADAALNNLVNFPFDVDNLINNL